MSFEQGSGIVLSDCMGARTGERLLVVTDTEKQPIGEALFKGGHRFGTRVCTDGNKTHRNPRRGTP